MSNEAAERLMKALRSEPDIGVDLSTYADLVDAALTAERKATVERIRAAAIKKWNGPGHVLPSEWFAILDAEAKR